MNVLLEAGRHAVACRRMAQPEGCLPADCAGGGGEVTLQLVEEAFNQAVNAGSVRGLWKRRRGASLVGNKEGNFLPGGLVEGCPKGSPYRHPEVGPSYFSIQRRHEDCGHPKEAIVEGNLFGSVFPHGTQEQHITVATV